MAASMFLRAWWKRTAVGVGVLSGTCLAMYSQYSDSSSSLLLHAAAVDPASKYMAAAVTQDLEQDDSIRGRFERVIMEVQKEFCDSLELIDGSQHQFKVDKWTRPSGGGGISCVLSDGEVFEKAGVNVSVVNGRLSAGAMKQMRAHFKPGVEVENPEFRALGISSVIHPRSPMVPTLHFNFRYFEVDLGNGETAWWFGGGADLTPYYLSRTDAKHFHGTLKAVCDKHDASYYPRFKKWCDEYFYIKHRKMGRGLGGIFFDDLDSPSPCEALAFSTDCARSMTALYVPIVMRGMNRGYGYRERQWQLLRRGHYAEFNLVYDRGTKFGLETPDARIESVLVSLPPYAKWEYMHELEKGSEEEKLQELLKNPIEWAE